MRHHEHERFSQLEQRGRVERDGHKRGERMRVEQHVQHGRQLIEKYQNFNVRSSVYNVINSYLVRDGRRERMRLERGLHEHKRGALEGSSIG